MKIVLLKLITGEEIIARRMPTSISGKDEFEKPRVLALTPIGPGQVGASLMPWVVGNPDGKFIIDEKHIITQCDDIPKNLEDTYLQNTSGIQILNG